MINEPKKWEYRLFVQSVSALPRMKPPAELGEPGDESEAAIESLGIEGWEVASVTTTGEDLSLFVFKRPQEDQRRRLWALEYLDSPEVNRYDEVLDTSTTHVVCCPFGLNDRSIDFESDGMEAWRNQYRLRYGPWRPSSLGMRAGWETQDHAHQGEPFWHIHHNGTVSLMRATFTREEAPEAVPVAGILHGVGSLLELCKQLYAAVGYDGPALLRARVTECAGMRFQVPTGSHPLSEAWVADTSLELSDGLLQVEEYLSSTELIHDPVPILRRIAKRIFHTLGYWKLSVSDQQLEEMLKF